MTQAQALSILKTGANVFLTGEPGSGKSYTINQYVTYLKEHGIAYAVTASTGIAATHIGGMTIHSWSGVGIRDSLSPYELDMLSQKEYLAKRIQKTNVLIIDEISMLGNTMLDTINAVCKSVRGSDAPFGGLQIILVGDYFQLPPVVRNAPRMPQYNEMDPYASEGIEEPTTHNFSFGSDCWKEAGFITCYLSEQHRQEDDSLLGILSMMRSGERMYEIREMLEERIHKDRKNLPPVTKLYSHNYNVDTLNSDALTKLAGMTKKYTMTTSGTPALIENLKKGCLSPQVLELKVGAKVMFTKNSPTEGYMNGTLGEVISLDNSFPIVKTKDGTIITVQEMEWMVEEDGKVKARLAQVPLRLAWAITIHKSQGMSLDSAIMDLSNVFEYGQGYVALSRVRTLDGIYLLGFNERALEVHPLVLRHDEQFRAASDVAEETFGTLTNEQLAQMHTNFIIASGGSIKPRKSSGDTFVNTKVSTVSLTYDLFQEGFSVAEIMKKRSLTLATVVTHLEKMLDHPDEFPLTKKIEDAIDAKLKKRTKTIFTLFKKFESLDPIKPIYEAGAGKYSYDELHVARLLYKQRK